MSTVPEYHEDRVPASGSARFGYNPKTARNITLTIIFGGAIGGGFTFGKGGSVDPWALYILISLIIVFSIGCYLYFISASKRSIELLFDERVIVLRHMVYPTRFWDIYPKREIRVPFSDVLSIRFQQAKMMYSYQVYTKRSRFIFSEYFERVEQLADHIEQIASTTPGVRLIRRFDFIIYCAAAGIIAGAFVLSAGWMLGWI